MVSTRDGRRRAWAWAWACGRNMARGVTAYRSGVEEGVLKGLVAGEQLLAQEGGIPDVLEQGDVHRRV